MNQLLIYSTSIPMKHGNPGNPEKFRGHQERLGRAENRRGSESSEANSAPCGSQSAFVGRIVGGNTSVHYHLNHPKVFNIWYTYIYIYIYVHTYTYNTCTWSRVSTPPGAGAMAATRGHHRHQAPTEEGPEGALFMREMDGIFPMETL